MYCLIAKAYLSVFCFKQRIGPGIRPWSWFPHASILGLLCGGLFTLCEQGKAAVVGLNTGGGAPLVSEVQTLFVDAAFAQPRIQFNFGFATVESMATGGFLDSFTVTAQTSNGLITAVFLTADANGTLLAPVTPGAVTVDASGIILTPLNYPNLMPQLTNQYAYQISAPLPVGFFGMPIHVYFDLFDNMNAQASQGWYGDLQVVLEPSVGLITLVGLALIGAIRRPSRCENNSTRPTEKRHG